MRKVGVCTVTYTDTDEVIECPVKKFDEAGEVCKPEQCEHYMEVDEDDL